MAKAASFDIDEAKLRKQLDRKAKRLYGVAHGVLLNEQEPLKERIIKRAPEDTGATKDNVYVDVVQMPNGPVLKAGIKDLPYPIYNEFGTEFMPAKPFFRPALAETAGYIRRQRGR